MDFVRYSCKLMQCDELDMNLFTVLPPGDARLGAPRAGLLAWGRRLFAAAAALVVLAQPALAAYELAPQYAGGFAAGNGADAEFYRIQNDWRGSAVLWTEPGNPPTTGLIGTFPWGTGLWGQVDWRAIQQAGGGQASAASGAIEQSFEGTVGAINHGNSIYNECYSASWGVAALVPFFDPVSSAGSCAPDAGDPAQQNWTARYSGFIRITARGEYNFSVLNDDGFFFRLIGADGAELGIGRDFLNPRDRIGFDQNLVLGEGLYGFELGAWNRAGAGVVDLRWTSGCSNGCQWTLLPTENLLTASQVPEPPAIALVALALLALWLAHPRRLARWRRSRCSRPGF
jgi:hypothetical protein